jgi:hypothetical protein
MIKLLLMILGLFTPAIAQAQRSPVFADRPVRTYRGSLQTPRWIKNVDGVWRDELGKLVDAPEINFAGRYFLAVHSCGTDCRYYTLTDLVTREDIEDVVNAFDSGEPHPKTSDGFPYSSLLYYRPNSNLLIVQYQVDKNGERECRERSYLFANRSLRPITKTLRACRTIE